MQEGCINIAIYLSVPVTCLTQSTNTLLEVIMLKIYCCDRKDFQEQGLAVIELVYEYRMGRSIGPHWSWGANVWIIGTEDIIKYLRSLRIRPLVISNYWTDTKTLELQSLGGLQLENLYKTLNLRALFSGGGQEERRFWGGSGR